MASTRTKRAFVRDAYDYAVEQSTTLKAILKTRLRARVTATAAGLVMISTAANGHETEFVLGKDFTAQDALDLAEELYTRYEEAVALLAVAEDGTADLAIQTEILRLLKPIRSIRTDHSYFQA